MYFSVKNTSVVFNSFNCRFNKETLAVLLLFYSSFTFADDKSKTFTCHSDVPCPMSIYSDYDGHTVENSYDFDITGNEDGLTVDDNQVSTTLDYTLANSEHSTLQDQPIPLNGNQKRYQPTGRPTASAKVTELQESIIATLINNSSKSEKGDITLRHNYGSNSDLFTYDITVLPPPPVCTTTIDAASIDMGSFTTSELSDLSPGQSTGESKSVGVTSQCTYSTGVTITLSTNKVTSNGELAAGGGINFLPLINSKDVTFTQSGIYSFSDDSPQYSYNFGVKAVRSDEKPTAGTYKNIITITTTPY